MIQSSFQWRHCVGSMLDKIKILADYYPIEDILAQNDIEPWVIIKFLVEEDLIDLEDYFYNDELVEED